VVGVRLWLSHETVAAKTDRDPEVPAKARVVEARTRGERLAKSSPRSALSTPGGRNSQERCELGKRVKHAPRKRAYPGLESWNPGTRKRGSSAREAVERLGAGKPETVRFARGITASKAVRCNGRSQERVGQRQARTSEGGVERPASRKASDREVVFVAKGRQDKASREVSGSG